MREMVKKIRNKAADVWRKVLLPALLATFYMLMETGTVAFAAGDNFGGHKAFGELNDAYHRRDRCYRHHYPR